MKKSELLSAAEAFVLLSLPRFDVRAALKYGFIGLLAQGILRIEAKDHPGLLRTRHIPHLLVAPNLLAPLAPIAASLVEVVRAAEPDGRMRDVLRQAMHAYGRTLVGFVQDVVGPALVTRGLAEQRQSRVLGLFPLTRFYCTPAGDAEKARLQALLGDARSIPTYVDSEPARAAALVAELGGAMLLVEELRPHYAAIEKALRPSDTTFTFTDTGSFSFDHGGGALCDFGHVDFSCFDAGAFDSFDAGFSDAGGDAGGGGGGSSGC
jgi:hypothetical protein